MSEVQYTVRDAINRLKEVNATGKTNLFDKGVDLPADEPTTTEVVDGIETINTGDSVIVHHIAEVVAPLSMSAEVSTADSSPSPSYTYTITTE